MKREFVQLAHTLTPKKHDVRGWWMSEKLDGMRCWWDGGITRGLPKDEVPWANTTKDERYVDIPFATGLWTRNGHPIVAPSWWLDQLPDTISLDGELWIGRGVGQRQKLMSVVKKLTPNPVDWKEVKFCVFDSPSYEVILADGVIDTPFFQKTLTDCIPWAKSKGDLLITTSFTFEEVYKDIITQIHTGDVIQCLEQEEVPWVNPMHWINEKLARLLEQGSEGVIIRNPYTRYLCARSNLMLKYKPWNDAEGIVNGYVSGRETDKGSKLLGLMGAMVLEYNDRFFELSGFTDAEREFGDPDAYAWACAHPGERMPDWVQHKQFPIGETVTFKYRELSAEGIPVEARYWRKA